MEITIGKRLIALCGLLALLLAGSGCLHVAPVSQDIMDDSDLRLCVAQVVLDFLESPWMVAQPQGNRPVGTLFVNLPQNYGAASVRTASGAMRSFDIDRDFMRPILRAIRDEAGCRSFWSGLRERHPDVWRRLCARLGENEQTWQPPALPRVFFSDIGYRLDGTCMYALNVTFTQTTKRSGDNRSTDDFRFMVHLVDIESAEMVLSSVVSIQHKWKRSFM